MIEKYEEEEDKEKCVNELFELNFTKLVNHPIFIKYCEKFNESAKDNYFDLFN